MWIVEDKDFLHILWRRFQEPCSLFPSLFATVVPRTSVLWDWVRCCHKIFGGLRRSLDSCFTPGQETWTRHARAVLDVPLVVCGLMLLWKLLLVSWKVLKQLQKYTRLCHGSFSLGTASVWTEVVQAILVSPASQPYKRRLEAPTLFPEEVKPEPTEGFGSHRHTERAPFRPKNFHLCLEHLREK